MALLFKSRNIKKMRVYQYLIFYCPLFYAYRSRYNQKYGLGILGFTFKYLVPTSLVVFLSKIFDVTNMGIGLFLIYNLYEIGYIQNDCETIKREEFPKLRLSSLEIQFYERQKSFIYLVRCIVGMLLSYLLFSRGLNPIYILFIWLLIPTYLLYNSMRNKWNLIIHAVLMFIRYYGLVLIATNRFVFIEALCVLFLYPVPVVIVLSVKGKFGGYRNKLVMRYLISNFNKLKTFRIKYYFLLLALFLILNYYNVLTINIIIPFVYFLLFNVISHIYDLKTGKKEFVM